MADDPVTVRPGAFGKAEVRLVLDDNWTMSADGATLVLTYTKFIAKVVLNNYSMNEGGEATTHTLYPSGDAEVIIHVSDPPPTPE